MPPEVCADEVSVEVKMTSGAAKKRDIEFFIDNLLVQIHFIIELIIVDRPCAM